MNNCRIKTLVLVFFLGFISYTDFVIADGSFIDKVYHPYVQSNEKELEWRWVGQKDSDNKKQDNFQIYRFAYGQSITDTVFLETYLNAQKSPNNNFKLLSAELEAIWQLTEQGEYFADWGILMEVEHEVDAHISEISSALLIESQWQKWVATANLYLIYEWGNSIDNEFETALATQVKYRYTRHLEPAIEFYSSDLSKGIGPVILGDFKLSGKKKVFWETGVIFALDDKTADQTFKFQFELEF